MRAARRACVSRTPPRALPKSCSFRRKITSGAGWGKSDERGRRGFRLASWRPVPPVSPQRPASCGRTPIHRGRSAWCCRFRRAACSTSSAGRGPTRSARAGCSTRSLSRTSPAPAARWRAASVAHASPDGYTIFLGTTSIHLTEMVLREHPLLDPMKDLQMDLDGGDHRLRHCRASRRAGAESQGADRLRESQSRQDVLRTRPAPAR